MHNYVLIYNRLTNQNIGPSIPPACVQGDTPKKALESVFGYKFKRVYNESAKSPDIVLVEGILHPDGVIERTGFGRMYFIATNRSPERKVSNHETRKRPKDPKTGRFLKYK